MECPLYTLDTKAKHEYRIHVFNGMIIDSQQKKKRNDHEGGIRGIRNHANGWVYAREGVVFPIPVLEQSLRAVKALGLNFGAVDIGYNELENTAYVYEVNSAPGLTGTTLDFYTNAFKEYYNGTFTNRG
jgi:glutathione synthase/RimK-type ligase-like ATP-grasp enzyme